MCLLDVARNQYDSQFSRQLSSSIKKDGQPTIDTKNLPTIPEPIEKTDIHLGDIKRTKSTHMNRNVSSSRRIAKRSTLMETPSPTSAFITSQLDSDLPEIMSDNQQKPIHTDNTQLSSSPTNIHPPVTLPTPTQPRPSQDYIKTIPKAKFYYFAELGSLDHYMLKHIAVLYLDELLKDYFSLEELADLIDDKKNSTLWGKFVTSLKTGGNKKIPTKGKTYMNKVYTDYRIRGNIWRTIGNSCGEERRGF